MHKVLHTTLPVCLDISNNELKFITTHCKSPSYLGAKQLYWIFTFIQFFQVCGGRFVQQFTWFCHFHARNVLHLYSQGWRSFSRVYRVFYDLFRYFRKMEEIEFLVIYFLLAYPALAPACPALRHLAHCGETVT